MAKKALVLLVVMVLALSMYVPLMSHSGSSSVITSFAGGAGTSTITFTGPGRNDSTKIPLDPSYVIKSAHMNVSCGAYNGNYPLGPGIDIGEDGDTEWQFVGQGYGSFGHQNVFSDDTSSKDFKLTNPAQTANVRLPADAQVTSAHLSVSGIFDPAFTKQVAYPDGLDYGRYLDRGDVNKDGYEDLLTVEPIEYGELAWYENPKTLSGNWQKHVINVMPYPYYAKLEDLDSDGDLDVIVSNNYWNAGIRWFNNTQGTGLAWAEWNINRTFSYAGCFDLADVSGDGLKDIVVLADYYSFGRLSWIERPSNLSRNWTTRLINSTVVSMTYLKVGNFDGDGHADIALTSDGVAGVRGLYLYKGPNDPSADPWVGKKLWDINYPEEVEISDLDNDAHPDIIVAYPGGNRVTWFESPDLPYQDTWVWHNLTTSVSGARCCALYDMDSDADLDILTAGVYGDKVYWLEHPAVATNAWTQHEIPSTIYSPLCIIPFDLDKSGGIDLAVSGIDFSQLVGLREASGNYQQVDIVNMSTYTPSYMAVGNFDNQYGDDVAYVSFSGNVLALRKPGPDPTANWTLEIIDPTLYYPLGVNATDMDGDGDLDLLACTYYGHDIYWYENKYSQTPSTPWLKRKVVEDTPDGYYRYLLTQDIDGKNATDIITYERWDDGSNDARNCLVWYEAPADPKNASQKWLRHVIANRLQNVYSFALGDLDGDGAQDLVFQQFRYSGGVYYGNVSWAQHPADYLGTLKPWKVRTATTMLQYPNDVKCWDIDGDGRSDILVTDYVLDSLYWLNTPQDPTAPTPIWNMYSVASSINSCWRVECADLGGDGHADLAVCNYWGNEVSWYIAPDDPTSALSWTMIELDNRSIQSYELKFGRFTSDGMLDVFVGCLYPGRLLWYDLSPLYPQGAGLDIGKDTLIDWSISQLNITQTSPDLKTAFNDALSGLIVKMDAYGNSYVDVPIGLSGPNRNATLFGIDITYSLSVQVPGSKIIQEIGQYISLHGTGGPMQMPIDAFSQSAGGLVLSDLVLNTNEAPSLIKPIPDNLTLNEDSSVSNLLELRSYFDDDYTYVNSLTFGVVNYTNPQFVVVSIASGHLLSVDATPVENWFGRTTVCVYAKDSDGFITYSNVFNVTILPVNDEPIAGPVDLPVVLINEGTSSIINMSAAQYFLDVDNDELYYKTDIDEQLPAIRENLSAVFQPDTGHIVITAKHGWTITGLILKVYCDDHTSIAQTLYKNLQVNVNNIVEPFAWKSTPILHVAEDSEVQSALDLDDFAKDPDHPGSPVTFTIKSIENSSYVDVTLNANNTLNVKAHDNFFGDSIVVIEARNQFAAVQGTLYITVDPVNDAPVFQGLSPENGTIVGSEDIYFSWTVLDVEADPLNYSFYLDEGPANFLIPAEWATTPIAPGLTEPRYTVESLKDNTTYFWWVGVSDGKAVVFSQVHTLIVSTTQILQNRFEVTYDEHITVAPGEKGYLTVNIRNTGTSTNYATAWLDSTSPQISTFVSMPDESKQVFIDGGDTKGVIMIIDFMTFTLEGEYNVQFSVQNGLTKEVTHHNLTITVEKEDGGGDTLNAMYYLLPILLLLLIIIVVVVVLVMRRKTAKDGEGARPRPKGGAEPMGEKAKTLLKPDLERDLNRSLSTGRPTPPASPLEPEVLVPEIEESPVSDSRSPDMVEAVVDAKGAAAPDAGLEEGPVSVSLPLVDRPDVMAEPEAMTEPEVMTEPVSITKSKGPPTAPRQGTDQVRTRYAYSNAKRGKHSKSEKAAITKLAQEEETLPELSPIDEAAVEKPKKKKGRRG